MLITGLAQLLTVKHLNVWFMVFVEGGFFFLQVSPRDVLKLSIKHYSHGGHILVSLLLFMLFRALSCGFLYRRVESSLTHIHWLAQWSEEVRLFSI